MSFLPAATLRARAIIPNKDLSILPGQFGRVRIVASSPYEALLIPDSAVARAADIRATFNRTSATHSSATACVIVAHRVAQVGLKKSERRLAC